MYFSNYYDFDYESYQLSGRRRNARRKKKKVRMLTHLNQLVANIANGIGLRKCKIGLWHQGSGKVWNLLSYCTGNLLCILFILAEPSHENRSNDWSSV